MMITRISSKRTREIVVKTMIKNPLKMLCFFKIHMWKSYHVGIGESEDKCRVCGIYAMNYQGYHSETYKDSKTDLKREEELERKYKSHIEKKKESQTQFERIVGNTPYKQIDWIIKHGFKRFYMWQEQCENGLKMYKYPIGLRPPLKQPKQPKEVNTFGDLFTKVEEISYVRGGRGNARLIGWSVKRTYDYGVTIGNVDEKERVFTSD